MAVMPGFQNITTLRTNNTGENLSSSSTDFFADRRQTALSRYVGVGLPGVPSLSDKRTLINRSFLISTNSLWKFGRGEFKANIDYSFNRVTADASNITTYFLDEGNRIITEKRNGKEHSHSLSGKFIYELNQKTAFINNTLQTNIDWDDVSLATTGSLPNGQSAKLPDYYVSNKFKMIKRFKGKHLVTFQSVNEWESLPQTLNLDMNSQQFRQHISDHAFFTHESAAYAFNIKGVTLSLEGGIKGYLRSMDSQLPELPEELPGLTENVVNTNYLTVYATPKLEYWVRRVNLSLDLPISYSHYSFDKAIANHNEVYFSPSLSFNWKPNNRFSGTLRGGIGRSPMNLNLIHPGLIMTNYRTLKSGVDDFYNSSSQNVSASFSYKHTRHGLFANGMVMHSWSHVPYTMAQQLYGDYVVYSYADAKNDGKTLMAMGNVGKTLDFMRGSCNVNGSFSRNESHLLSQQQSVNSVSSGWSVGGKINGNPCRWFSFDYRIDYSDSRLSMNGLSESWLSTLENELSLTFIPLRKWQWTVSGEHYRNELTEHNYKDIVMLDTKLTFQLNKKIEIAASLTNILNKRSYNYTTYSQLSSFESQRTSPNKRNKPVTSKMTLLASPTEAKYFNDLSLWVDSLKSTPEGKAQYIEILKKACMTVEPDGSTSWDLTKGPVKNSYSYVFTNLANESLTHYSKYGEDLGYYTEPLSELKWTIIEDSTATVLGYECIMTESDYHGRHWKAWFTPEIPMPFGPWKLHGLPGLILKAEANGGFSFVATGLEHTGRIMSPMYMKDDYSKVDRKEALRNAEYFINNEESIRNAQGQNVKIYTTDDEGNRIETPKYDGLKHSIEPDYKMK